MGIKVLVVDDSATAREILINILQSDEDISEIYSAQDAFEARDKIVALHPDIVCLDIEMPKMDGITFLKKIMKHFPLPVIMVSKMTKKGASKTFEALEAGAVDVIEKPDLSLMENKSNLREELLNKIKSLSQVNIKSYTHQIQASTLSHKSTSKEQKIIAIGVSTGGVDALKHFLPQFPKSTPAMVIVQHMPQNFTNLLALKLNEMCQMEVREAKNGDILTDGLILIAPGNYHIVVRKKEYQYFIELGTGEKVSGHRPSADVLFNSMAKSVFNNAIGIILTGMGQDGTKGLLHMRNSGAMTFGQDEKSCVVYGMPKIAFEIGAVVKQNSLELLPQDILKYLQKG